MNSMTGNSVDDYVNHVLASQKRIDEYVNQIKRGEALPPLYSDVISKRIFSPELHPERLEFLLKAILRDDSIVISSSRLQEAYRRSQYGKNIIMDNPALLLDDRSVDTEFQKQAQAYALIRGEIYSANALMLQYSVEKGHKKKEISYSNVKGAIMVFLLLDSPEPFREFDKQSARYIHRFDQMQADSGLTYKPLASTIYVQLDKCLAQFLNGENAENSENQPDELQLWLAMIADANDPVVRRKASENKTLSDIQREMAVMIQNREVLEMISKEEFREMDRLTDEYLKRQAFRERDEAVRERDEAFKKRDEAFQKLDEAFQKRDAVFEKAAVILAERLHITKEEALRMLKEDL